MSTARNHSLWLDGKRFMTDKIKCLHSEGGEPVKFAIIRCYRSQVDGYFLKETDTFLDTKGMKGYGPLVGI